MPRAAALLCLLAAPAIAQDGIVVTGASLPRASGDAAYDVATIDRGRLTATASGRLDDVLKDVAGFAAFRRSDSRSAQPTSQGATLRGLGGNAASRAIVLLDGVPLADPFGGWVSYAAVDPARLGLVRVTRGGGSGVAGPGALAGTIELSSARIADLAPLRAELLYGSRDSIEAHAGAAGRAGGGYAFVAASYARGDGFVPIVRADRGPADIPSPYEQASVAARAVFPIGGDAEVQASGSGFVDRRARGTAFTDNDTKGADASVRLVGDGRWGWETLGYVQMRSLAASFASLDDARTRATRTLDQYAVPSTAFGGRIELRPPTGDALQLRIGGDARAVDGETDELYTYVAAAPTRGRTAGGRALTVGGFAEASLRAARGLTLTAGGRIDRWRLTGGFLDQRVLATGAVLTAARYPDRDGTRPTARGGVAWKPADGAVTLRAAAYLGWRLPTLNELYRLYRVGADAIAADPALRPERSRGIDGGVDYDPLPNLHVSATGYAVRLADAIANVTVAAGPGVFPDVGFVSAAGRFQRRANLTAIVSRGAEFGARLGLRAWSLSLSYAFTDARVRGGAIAPALDGLRPAQTARHQVSGTLGWSRPGGPTLAATLRYAGLQYEDDLNTLRLRGAVTIDSYARLPIARGFALVARAENLADARIEAGISGRDTIERATPRTLWIGISYARAPG